MAEATNDLIYEVLRQIQSDVAALRDGQREQGAALNAIRSHRVGVQQDTQNIYETLVRHGERLDRIDRRLELTDSPAS